MIPKKHFQVYYHLVNNNSHSEWLNEFKVLYDIEFDAVIKDDIYPEKEGLTMGEVLKEINTQSAGKAAIVSDVGQHQMIACRYADFSQTRGNITSGGLGTMGFALPAALELRWEILQERWLL